MEIYAIPIRDTDTPEKYILYRPLLGLAFVGNKAMVDVTRAELTGAARTDQQQAVEFLQEIGFLQPDPAAPTRNEAEFKPTTAVLLLTNQCQLRCTYCYAAAGTFPRQELALDRAQIAIDYVCETAQNLGRDHFDLNFHGGGEPTLAWKMIEACVAYARDKPLPAEIALQSNGIWSVRKREWLLDHLDSLSLSMDGSPQTQDHQRPYTSGRGSSSKVMETIAALDRLKFPYGIRMTATAPWGNFPRDVRFLCESTKCRNLQVEPAFNTQRGGHRCPDLDEAHAFAEAFLEAHEIAQKAGRSLNYSGARLGQVTSTFCMAPYDALIVAVSGAIVTCYEVTSDAHSLSRLSTIGSVDDGAVHVNAAVRSSLHARIAERRDLCKKCFCYWSCAGDCYTRTFNGKADGHLQYGARCEANRLIMEKLLLGGIAAGEGVWRSPAWHVAPDPQHDPV